MSLVLLLTGVVLVGSGYYLLYSSAPDAPLAEVLKRARLGTVLVFAGSALLLACMYGASRRG